MCEVLKSQNAPPLDKSEARRRKDYMTNFGTHSANGQGRPAAIIPHHLSESTLGLNGVEAAAAPALSTKGNEEHVLISLCLQHPKLIPLVLRQVRPITCEYFMCAEVGRIFSAMYICVTKKQLSDVENITRELEDRLTDSLVTKHETIRNALALIPNLLRAPFPLIFP